MLYKRYHKKRHYGESYQYEAGFVGLLFVLFVGWYMKVKTRFIGLGQSYKILLIVGIGIVGISIFLIIRYIKRRESLFTPRRVNYTLPKSDNVSSEEIISPVNIDDKIAVLQRLRELHNRYFEELIARLFEMKGFKIIRYPIYDGLKAKKDAGIDIIVEKDWVEKLIQIKKNYKHPTGVNIIREIKGVAKTRGAMVVSTSIFSEDAERFAQENNIDLVDYRWLWNWIIELDDLQRQEVASYINTQKYIDTEFKYQPRTCYRCGAPYVKGRGGKLYCMAQCTSKHIK